MGIKISFRLKRFVLSLNLLYAGCAIHYHDERDNSDHVYGFGHLAMRAVTDGSKEMAIARQISTLGSELHVGDKFGLSLGWSNEEEIQFYNQSAKISLEKPSGFSIFSSMLKE